MSPNLEGTRARENCRKRGAPVCYGSSAGDRVHRHFWQAVSRATSFSRRKRTGARRAHAATHPRFRESGETNSRERRRAPVSVTQASFLYCHRFAPHVLRHPVQRLVAPGADGVAVDGEDRRGASCIACGQCERNAGLFGANFLRGAVQCTVTEFSTMIAIDGHGYHVAVLMPY